MVEDEPSAARRSSTPGWTRRASVVIAVAAACVPLVVLSDRAFNIDEPLFLWLAEQITREPLDFFGFDVNWYGTAQPMYAVTRNPPLIGYVIAAAAAVVGWGERALHLVFLIPAIGAVCGAHAIARRSAREPLLAVLLAVATPVFLVSSNTIMSDTPMLALWCIAIACWMRAGDRPHAAAGESGPVVRWLWIAGALAAACASTKYFGVALVPLLAAYSLAAGWPLRRWAPPLALPLLALLGIEATMYGLYGAGALAQATAEALHVEGIERPGLLRQAAEGLAFAGGCALPALIFAPLLWSRRTLAIAAALVVLVVVLAPASLTALGLPLRAASESARGAFGPERQFALQFAAFALGGITLVGLAVAELRARREPERLLLALWLLGTLVFAAFVNWTNNGRSNLPLAPVAGILIARRLDRRQIDPRRIATSLALGLSALLAVGAAYADRSWSNSVRSAAREIAAQHGGARTLWFQGHWGWQYYLEREGGRAIDWRRDVIAAGETLVVPTNNAEMHLPAAESAALIDVVTRAEPRWLHTQAKALGASYNASNLGPAPFLVGPPAPDQYRVYRARRPIRYERWFEWSERAAADE